MDKVLTRKLFKEKYLKGISKFNKGGIASLRIHHFDEGGSASSSYTDPNILKQMGVLPTKDNEDNYKAWPLYTEGEKTAINLAPIISSLLSGKRMPGQSQLGAVASNVGESVNQVVQNSMKIKQLEDERLGAIVKVATTQMRPNWSVATDADKAQLYGSDKKNWPDPNTIIQVKKDLQGNITDNKIVYNQNEEVSKYVDKLSKNKLLSGGLENDIDNFLNTAAPYLQKSGGKNLPGFGPIEGREAYPNKLIADNGLLQSLFQRILNQQIKDYSGTAVSGQELERDIAAAGGGKTGTTIEPMIQTLLTVKDKINKEKMAVLQGAKPEVFDDLISGGSLTHTDLPGIYDNYKQSAPNLFNDPNITTITNKDGKQIKYKVVGNRTYALAMTPAPGQPMDEYVTPRKWLPVTK